MSIAGCGEKQDEAEAAPDPERRSIAEATTEARQTKRRKRARTESLRASAADAAGPRDWAQRSLTSGGDIFLECETGKEQLLDHN